MSRRIAESKLASIVGRPILRAWIEVLVDRRPEPDDAVAVVLDFERRAVILSCAGNGGIAIRDVKNGSTRGGATAGCELRALGPLDGETVDSIEISQSSVSIKTAANVLTLLNDDDRLIVSVNGAAWSGGTR